MNFSHIVKNLLFRTPLAQTGALACPAVSPAPSDLILFRGFGYKHACISPNGRSVLALNCDLSSIVAKEIQRKSGEKQLTIGRAGKGACISIKDSRVSALHVKVEEKEGNFILTDSSTQGTYYLEPRADAWIKLNKDQETKVPTGTIVKLIRTTDDSTVWFLLGGKESQ